MVTKRLPEGKRLRSEYIEMHIDNLDGSAVFLDYATETWTPQDDITIVGYNLRALLDFGAAPTMVSGDCVGVAELTRSAKNKSPGIIGTISVSMEVNVKTAETAMLGSKHMEDTIFFPDGIGVEVDEGESINLLGLFSGQGIVAAAACDCSFRAVIYYVER